MLKKVLSILFLVFQFLCFSQKVEFGLSYSYSLSTPNSIIGQQEKTIYDSEFSISNIRGSLASGSSFGLNSSIKIHPNVKLSLGYDYLQNKETLFMISELNYTLSKTIGSAKQQKLYPGIVFFIPIKKLNFYFKTALVVPLKTETYFEDFASSELSGNYFYQKTAVKYNYVTGYQNVMGVEINLHEKLKIAFSLESILLNMRLKNSEILSFEENQSNQLSNLSTYDKQTNYAENLNNFSNNANYNNLYSETQAKDELTSKHDYSSVSLRFSVIYIFKYKKK
jgi:hypothetical protein